MDDLVNKFSTPGEMAVDLFPSTFAMEKACLELPRRCHLVGCEGDADCFAESTETLFGTYVRQILNEKSDNIGATGVVDA